MPFTLSTTFQCCSTTPAIPKTTLPCNAYPTDRATGKASGGSALFERLGRSVRLTSAGESLHKMALGILQQIAEAEKRLAALNEGYDSLRIGVIPKRPISLPGESAISRANFPVSTRSSGKKPRRNSSRLCRRETLISQ
jgi:hypothetical protein